MLRYYSFIFFTLFLASQPLARIPHDDSETPSMLSKEDISQFDRDGYVVKRGLLDDNVDAVLEAIENMEFDKNPMYFSVAKTGPMFESQAFRDTALYSMLPQAVAELMQLDPATQNLRILRDVYLAKDIKDPKVCDWHVDDLGFWPASYLDDQGINVWIALDDMPYSGSMAVCPGSHRAEWRHEAYQVLGQNRTEDGGLTKEQIRKAMLESKNYLTCDMHETNPEMYQKMEEQAVHFDLKKGDIIFATRLLFHRTAPVTPEGIEYYDSIGQANLKRYSIRYVPGETKLANGWNVEWSNMNDPNAVGNSLDDITMESDYAFYPQVWPTTTAPTSMDAVRARSVEWAAMAKKHVQETLFGPMTTSKE